MAKPSEHARGIWSAVDRFCIIATLGRSHFISLVVPTGSHCFFFRDDS